MIDLSDSCNIEVHSTGVTGNMLIFDQDVIAFLTLLEYKRGQVKKPELILKYPFWGEQDGD